MPAAINRMIANDSSSPLNLPSDCPFRNQNPFLLWSARDSAANLFVMAHRGSCGAISAPPRLEPHLTRSAVGSHGLRHDHRPVLRGEAPDLGSAGGGCPTSPPHALSLVRLARRMTRHGHLREGARPSGVGSVSDATARMSTPRLFELMGPSKAPASFITNLTTIRPRTKRRVVPALRRGRAIVIVDENFNITNINYIEIKISLMPVANNTRKSRYDSM